MQTSIDTKSPVCSHSNIGRTNTRDQHKYKQKQNTKVTQIQTSTDKRNLFAPTQILAEPTQEINTNINRNEIQAKHKFKHKQKQNPPFVRNNERDQHKYKQSYNT